MSVGNKSYGYKANYVYSIDWAINLFWFVGHIQWCSCFTPGYVLKDQSWQFLRYHMR